MKTTPADRYAILNRRYTRRVVAIAAAKRLGANYCVKLTNEGICKYFRVAEFRRGSHATDALAYALQPRFTKPYRVFYRHGVYEYYRNAGGAPYHWYARYGQLVGAYNTHAAAWAKFI